MMVLFGRVIGGVVAGLLIGATILFQLDTGTSFLLAAATLLVLGVVREPITKWIGLRERQAVAAVRRIRARIKFGAHTGADHAGRA
jgi:predicted lipid-binding transport protein (Tim44 family)